jgi:hypothetical protein
MARLFDGSLQLDIITHSAGCPVSRVSLREVGTVHIHWEWWRRVDSNHGPTDYETVALAT